MAIAKDVAEEHNGSQPSPFSFTSTASVSASATVMIAGVVFQASVAAMGTVTMSWNGVSMSAIGSGVNVGGAGGTSVFMFGLKSPASGAKILRTDWTGGNTPAAIYLGYVTFTGSDTSGTGWNNNTSNTGGSSSPATVTVTTTSGDMAVAVEGNTGGAPSDPPQNGTKDWLDTNLTPNGAEAHNAASGTSTTVSWTLGGSSGDWAVIGVNVQQPQSGVTTDQLSPVFAFQASSGMIGRRFR